MKKSEVVNRTHIDWIEFIRIQRKNHKSDINIHKKMVQGFREAKEFSMILDMKKSKEQDMIIEYMILFSSLDVMPLFDDWALDKCVAFFDFQILSHLTSINVLSSKNIVVNS